MVEVTSDKGRVLVGYDHVADARRTNADQKFETWFDQPDLIESLSAASVRAAREVGESTDKEIVILYSGGMDSEWILESFFLAGVPVTPLLVNYRDGLNDHDMAYAQRYLGRRGITKSLLDTLDLRKWYGSQAQKDIAELSQTPELAYTTQFQAIEKLNNGSRFFITGYDEPGIQADDSAEVRRWNLFYNERHYSVVKLFRALGVPGIPNWGRYSSALLAAYVCQPQWQMLVANLYNPTVWNAEMIKIPMFQAHFPFMEARPKFTGFEKSLSFIIDETRKWKNSVKERLGYNWSDEWRCDIHEVWDTLGLRDRHDR